METGPRRIEGSSSSGRVLLGLLGNGLLAQEAFVVQKSFRLITQDTEKNIILNKMVKLLLTIN